MGPQWEQAQCAVATKVLCMLSGLVASDRRSLAQALEELSTAKGFLCFVF